MHGCGRQPCSAMPPCAQVYLHLHRLSTHHLGVNMQNAAECLYTFVDRDTCQLQLAFRWAQFCSHHLLAD